MTAGGPRSRQNRCTHGARSSCWGARRPTHPKQGERDAGAPRSGDATTLYPAGVVDFRAASVSRTSQRPFSVHERREPKFSRTEVGPAAGPLVKSGGCAHVYCPCPYRMRERDAFTFLYPWGVPDSDTNPAVRTYRDTLAATLSG